ncbi:hypothetical protein BDN70DRAFT_105702 [Pholiota conissans]|uniref:F-box domain-containing protein n=1 Tax=Pholiota conissans TaxID=109636 RepID=A0A9P6D649_9AGAR|nr:hypothetical protein BDN70DRAFT_105702 [Pholiota conissans]
MQTSNGLSFSAPLITIPPPLQSRTIPTEKAGQIAVIDAEIMYTDDVISKYLDYRCTLSRHRNSLLPSINLPREILEMIFEWARHPLEDEDFIFTALPEIETTKKKDIPPATPFLIASVCSVWRTVVLEAPQLWSNIEIKVSQKDSKRQAEQLTYWISKSGQRPLTVTLLLKALEKEFGDDDSVDDQDDVYILSTEVIDILIPHAHRIQALDTFVPWSWAPTLAQIVESAHQLKTITPRLGGSPDDFVDQLDLFASSPKLRDAMLIGYSFSNITLPWSQLERLELDLSGVHQCFEILRLCPRLRIFMFDLVHDDDSDDIPPSPSPITHKFLESIELRVDIEAELAEFLEQLTLPALRSFTSWISIEGRSYTGRSIPSLLPFIARSQCKLERLSLVGTIPPYELAECLQALPSLRELLLYDPQEGMKDIQRDHFDQRMLDLMNPKNFPGSGGNGVGSLVQSRHRAKQRNNSDIPGEDLVYQRGSKVCLGPNLETILFRGKLSIKKYQDLVEFLAYRWYGPSADLEIQSAKRLGKRSVGKRAPQVAASTVQLRSATFINPMKGLELEDDDVAVLLKLKEAGMHVELLGYGALLDQDDTIFIQDRLVSIF